MNVKEIAVKSRQAYEAYLAIQQRSCKGKDGIAKTVCMKIAKKRAHSFIVRTMKTLSKQCDDEACIKHMKASIKRVQRSSL